MVKVYFPYDEKGNPLSEEQMQNHKQAYQHLLKHKDLLTKKRDIKNYTWFYLDEHKQLEMLQ